MSAAKKGLGRGFDSLIPTDLFDDSFDPTVQQDVKVSQQTELPISQITANPDQPRRAFDNEALTELADSIREHGVLQPIIVVSHKGGYQIVAGERRYRASKLAGLNKVPVIVRTMNGQNQLEVALIENIQRRDLNAIETATAYAKLRDQFNMTTEQISKRVHKSPSAVTNTMRLLKLPKDVIMAIAEGKITEGQARPLIGQSEEAIIDILPRIIGENWSARRVEQYILQLKQSSGDQTGSAGATNVYQYEQDSFQTKFNSKVAIKTTAKGSGKIVISFNDADDFQRIKNILG